MKHLRHSATALALLLSSIRSAGAVTVDGVLDPEYGTPLVVQSLQTSSTGGQLSGDNTQADLDWANGSELDLAYGFVADGALHLFFSGNLAKMLNQNQNGTVRHVLDIFLDTQVGGQTMLNGLGSGVVVNGLQFDDEFAADHWFEMEGDDQGFSGPRYWTVRYTAITMGGGSLVRLGDAQAGAGTLTGGTNPHGVMATLDNRNVAGVGAGCGSASGAGVTTGIEFRIPLGAIGNAAGCMRITAFVRSGASVSNQVMAPLPAGTCPLGMAGSVDFGAIAGSQFFTLCQTTDVGTGPDEALAMALLGPNPSSGEHLRIAFTLRDARPARLQLMDAAGRLLRERRIEGVAGRGTLDLSDGRRLAPGVYWIRLAQGRARTSRRIAIVP